MNTITLPIPDEYRSWIRRRPDEWYTVLPELQTLQSMSTGLGDIYPRCTNGIIVIGERVLGHTENQWFMCHRNNLPLSWRAKDSASRVKKPKEKKPRVKKVAIQHALTLDVESLFT